MRLLELQLLAIGPFSGAVLDLKGGKRGLHLIYGPNEAGKSSALRAIRDLLFGMPQVTQDAHLHAAPALRLSAVIERDGEELAFVRRKKRKDSLVGLDDTSKPLRSKLLAVPALRARYLGYVREIADKWLDWRTIDTPHFRVNYAAGLDSLAYRAAARAEWAYEVLTEELASQRGRATHM